MALDEPQENDQVFTENGVTFLVDKELYESVKPISVEFVESPMGAGFKITSELSKNASCGTGCSC